ncbi:MAG TPA: glycosyl hydrolase family 18 protein [Candidatus Polarisedimenticolia bacterium]|nr:glycosyl hydrolase family 18 protein [Candidatus Polarisedimenticolia bacterium]
MHGIAVTVLALGGWIVPWQHDAGVATLDRTGGALSDVFLFAARLDGDGFPVLDERGDQWKETADRARTAGATVWLTIVNDRVAAAAQPVLKDSEVLHFVFADREAGARHRSGILALAKRLGVDGVDVDYENLPASDRDGFTAFARRLAADLRTAGLKVSITVQPKSGETASRGPGGADWAALCTVADRLQVMLYNEHNAATGPGPVASLDWMTRVINYGLGLCPASKLVPVIKVLGMDWGPSQAEWRSFGEVDAILARTRPRRHREGVNRVPWFVYSDAGARHVVYYEDSGSLIAKADRLRKRGLKRLVLWSLGSEDPDAIPALGRAQKR